MCGPQTNGSITSVCPYMANVEESHAIVHCGSSSSLTWGGNGTWGFDVEISVERAS